MALAAHNFEPFTGLGIPFEHQDAGAANFRFKSSPARFSRTTSTSRSKTRCKENREGQQREGRKTCCFYQNGDVRSLPGQGDPFPYEPKIRGNDGLIPRKESDDVIADFLQTQIHSPAVLS